tara:strand:+ start:487 stop:738 length:252 start_codon:yes stop_codon:yes gene_type:complete
MAKTWNKNEIGKSIINETEIELSDAEKTAIAIEWTNNEKEIEDIITAETNAKNKKTIDKTNANNKLKALGLTDDEIKAIKGIN